MLSGPFAALRKVPEMVTCCLDCFGRNPLQKLALCMLSVDFVEFFIK